MNPNIYLCQLLLSPPAAIWAITRYQSCCRVSSRTCTSLSGCMSNTVNKRDKQILTQTRCSTLCTGRCCSRGEACEISKLHQFCKIRLTRSHFWCRILENNNIHQISSLTFSGLNSLVLLWVPLHSARYAVILHFKRPYLLVDWGQTKRFCSAERTLCRSWLTGCC